MLNVSPDAPPQRSGVDRVLGRVTICVLSFVVVIALSGCASLGLYKGLALPTCNAPLTSPKYQSGDCMTGAEYDAARKKALYNSGTTRSSIP